MFSAKVSVDRGLDSRYLHCTRSHRRPKLDWPPSMALLLVENGCVENGCREFRGKQQDRPAPQTSSYV